MLDESIVSGYCRVSMCRKTGDTHMGKTLRRRASGEVATTTRCEKKTGETGAEEHYPRNEVIAEQYNIDK